MKHKNTSNYLQTHTHNTQDISSKFAGLSGSSSSSSESSPSTDSGTDSSDSGKGSSGSVSVLCLKWRSEIRERHKKTLSRDLHKHTHMKHVHLEFTCTNSQNSHIFLWIYL